MSGAGIMSAISCSSCRKSVIVLWYFGFIFYLISVQLCLSRTKLLRLSFSVSTQLSGSANLRRIINQLHHTYCVRGGHLEVTIEVDEVAL